MANDQSSSKGVPTPSSPPTPTPNKSHIPNPTPVTVPKRRGLFSRFTSSNPNKPAKPARKWEWPKDEPLAPSQPRNDAPSYFAIRGMTFAPPPDTKPKAKKAEAPKDSKDSKERRPTISRPILPEDNEQIFASRLRPPTNRPTTAAAQTKIQEKATVPPRARTPTRDVRAKSPTPQLGMRPVNRAASKSNEAIMPRPTSMSRRSRIISPPPEDLNTASREFKLEEPQVEKALPTVSSNSPDSLATARKQKLARPRVPPSGRSSALSRGNGMGGRATPGARKAQNFTRVQELRAKVSQLEHVMLQDRLDRNAITTQAAQIEQLQAQLEEERSMRRQIEDDYRHRVVSDHRLLPEPMISSSSDEASSPTMPAVPLTPVSMSSPHRGHGGPNVVVARPLHGMNGLWDNVTEIPASPSRKHESTMLRSQIAMYVENNRASQLSQISRISENSVSTGASTTSLATDRISAASTSPTLTNGSTSQLPLRKNSSGAFSASSPVLGASLLSSNRLSLNIPTYGSTRSAEDVASQQQKVELMAKVSMLENDNSVLQREKTRTEELLENGRKEMKSTEDQLSMLRDEINTLKASLDEGTQLQTKISTQREQAYGRIEQLMEEIDVMRASRNNLQRQVSGYQMSQRMLEKQLSLAQKESRRSERLITALETNVNDLKLTIEEKNMENDELNNSISRVMQQASSFLDSSVDHDTMTRPAPAEVEV